MFLSSVFPRMHVFSAQYSRLYTINSITTSVQRTKFADLKIDTREIGETDWKVGRERIYQEMVTVTKVSGRVSEFPMKFHRKIRGKLKLRRGQTVWQRNLYDGPGSPLRRFLGRGQEAGVRSVYIVVDALCDFVPGTQTFPDGSEYVGQWSNNFQEGHGKCIYANNSR